MVDLPSEIQKGSNHGKRACPFSGCSNNFPVHDDLAVTPNAGDQLRRNLAANLRMQI
jgi:hypothetical protein